jgi:predicted RNase H-like HicB family nuclease
MKKNLKYYLNLPYTAIISPAEDNDGSICYVARLLELPHCIGVGKTPEEAVSELEIHKRLKLEGHLELGFPIPEPSRYTGQFHLRVGTSLHESLARLAELEDISLNQYITNILARNVGAEENRLSKSRKVLSRK